MLKSFIKKTSAIFLSLILMVDMIPSGSFSVFAEEADEGEPAEETQSDVFDWRYVVTEEEFAAIRDINFDSCRLIAAIDPAYIIDKTVILSEYNGVYLLQFEDADTTQAAYAYLSKYAEFIDVDSVVFASEEAEVPEVMVNTDEMTAEENPFTALDTALSEDKAEEDTDAPEQTDDDRIIALIDTGAGYYQETEEGETYILDPHVIKQVSVIPGNEGAEDEKRVEETHADRMVSFIAEEAADARILSIQALDDDGVGNVSAVYAAIMYAIESGADMINLSLSAPATAENAVLKSAISSAVDNGIDVVVSAGNNNKDIRFYTPGNIEEAYTIGAVDANGNRIASSNYGEAMDYAVAAQSTSEAAARFTGILYDSSIEEIEASLDTGKVFSPIRDKVTVQENIEDEPAVDTENSDFEAADNRGVTSIDYFEARLIAGAKEEDEKWVWNANRNSEDHRFAFRVLYSTSGVDKLMPGELEFRVPLKLLKNRNGDYSDQYEVSYLHEDEVTVDDVDQNMLYRIEGDEIVIYNRFEMPAAAEGYFDISYGTVEKVTEYADMSPSDAFQASMTVKGATEDTLSASAQEDPVYINTAVELISTSKKYPQLYKTWQPSWGEAPANAENFWYVRWEIVSEIDKELTQPYNFTITDTLGTIRAWNGENQETEVPEGAVQVFGLKMAGESGYSNITTQTERRGTGKRYDYVITTLDAQFFRDMNRLEIQNNIETTVDPIDQVDEDSAGTSSKVFKYQKPVFSKPNGRFQIYKYGDGSYRAERSGIVRDLGVKYGLYSRYDLETLKEGDVDSLDNFDYIVMGLGYPYPWTLEDGADWQDTTKYGIKPVKYSLVDDGVYLHEDGGIANTTEPMTGEDYQIDSIRFASYNNDAVFNEEIQAFYPTAVTYVDTDILTFFIKLNSVDSEWIEVATYNLKTSENTFNSEYVDSFEGDMISFRDNVVSFKIETSNAHYYTNLRAKPMITLKGSDHVLDTIQDWDSIALRNDSHLDVTQDEKSLFDKHEADTDFARITQRDSFIDKVVVSSFNEVRRKQYRITWQMHGFERYILNEGVPDYVEQESGTFYDLLPAGLEVDRDSIMIATAADPTAKTKRFTYLYASAFEVSTVPNYKDTGRTLLKVHVKEPATNYFLFFDTLIDWNTITDIGSDVYNPMAYQTGNESIKDGRPDDGGDLAESELMSGLTEEDDGSTFIYGEEYFDIVAITSGRTGLTKQVKAESDASYTYDTTVSPNGNYTYRLRYANSFLTRSKDMILFDSLETYGTEGLVGSDIVEHEPDWKGTLQGVDVSQLKLIGIDPVIYVSETDALDLDDPDNHDIENTAIWQTMDEYILSHDDLTSVKAVAIDARKDMEGNDFILDRGQSIMAVLFMKAPGDSSADGTRIPETFNNVYFQNTTIDRFDNEQTFYVHHDYTTVKMVVRADVGVDKYSSEDATVKIRGVQFRIEGTSDYGTEVSVIETTDKNGRLTFTDIEKGTYILQEYQATPDWLEDHTEHTLVIDNSAKVWIDGVEYTDSAFGVENSPRVHADIKIVKKEPGASDVPEFEEDVWDPETMVKYAVALYGIEQDLYENGDPMGLTFGPATGANYVNSYKSHTPTGETSKGNAHRCIHEDSWEGICYWNLVDPYVYEQCIKVGCTHSVNLTLSDTLRNSDFVPSYTGDGPSALYDELAQRNKGQDISYNTNGITGGWGASRIRALLNGADELTNVDPITGTALTVAGNAAERYTEGNTLFDAFPDILKNTIEAKNVKYDPRQNEKIEEYLQVSHDKLWLLSPNEMGDNTTITNENQQHPLEALADGVYQRFEQNEKPISGGGGTNGSNFFRPRRVDGTPTYAWLRSLMGNHYGRRVAVLHSYIFYADNNTLYGVSPCFVLSRDASRIAANMEASGKTTEWINDIVGYQAKNSNPALQGLIPNTTFKLFGTSDYGTEVSEIAVSNNRGVIIFGNIEKGKYQLKEVQENPDFVRTETVYNVTIDDNGIVSSDMDKENSVYYSITNEPRYWDLSIRKVDKEDRNIWLQGATVHLYGTSDFNNEVDVTVTSDANGKIVFEGIEKGTYFLEETEAPTGVDAQGHTGTGGNRNYVADPAKHIVTISESGNVIISGLTIGPTGEYYLENDRKLDGRITVIKHWVSFYGEVLPTPQLTLTSVLPGTEPAYRITYDANHGLFDNGTGTNVVYITSEGKLNIIKEGEEKIPDPPEEGMVFDGWYKDRGFTERFSLTGEITENMTVYAKWKETRTRYAVSLYGIEQDVDRDGNTMGLTFGPATGANYVNSYKRHDATGETNHGNAHRCIHNDLWYDIIYWNEIDPEVYEQCVGECCTKSVPLELSDDLKNASFQPNYTGDGPSQLYYEFAVRSTAGEATWNSSGTNKGGWGASRIRALLNGADELTNVDPVTGSATAVAGNAPERYTGENTLLAAFPSYLQDAIGYKAVKYDSVFNANTEANLKVSYDKLWLLSSEEIADSSTVGTWAHPFEALDDGVYQRIAEYSKIATSGNDPFYVGYRISNATSGAVGTSSWWLRSLGWTVGQYSYYVTTNGNLASSTAAGDRGVAPCFSLSRNGD